LPSGIAAFGRCELDQFEKDLALMASGVESAGMVHNVAKRVIARKISKAAIVRPA